MSPLGIGKEGLYIMCNVHQTKCKFMCCDNAVCLYCANREHINHPHNSLVTETNKIEQAIDIEIKKYENIKKNSFTVKQNIDIAENLFEVSLQSRKRKCIEDYIILLNKEESVLRENFNAVVSDYKNILNMENLDELKNIYKKTEIELVLLKKNITQSIEQLSLKNLVSYNLSMSDSKYGSEHPLGELIVDRVELDAGDLAKHPSFEYNDTQIKMVSKATELFEELARLYQNGKFNV